MNAGHREVCGCNGGNGESLCVDNGRRVSQYMG